MRNDDFVKTSLINTDLSVDNFAHFASAIRHKILGGITIVGFKLKRSYVKSKFLLALVFKLEYRNSA